MTVLQLALKIVIFIAVGVVARKLKVMADGFDKQLSRFLMAIPLPCMIINPFRIEFSVAELLSALFCSAWRCFPWQRRAYLYS